VLLLLTAFTLGVVHSFAPDHLAAVGAFASRRPSWRGALGLGARWGIGHSLTILLLGGVLVASGVRLPAAFDQMAERAVGVILVVVGIATVWRAFRLHAHWHAHDGEPHLHVHSHARGEGHDHSHRALLGIGMLHGVAGTGALVIALPSGLEASLGVAFAFLLVFGLGTVLAMALFGAAAGRLVTAAARVSLGWHRAVIAAAGAASIGIGLWWVVLAGA
jgi:sulfite exporter TauE/SafE